MRFTLDTAIGVAQMAHFGQLDMARQAYIRHVLRVMEAALRRSGENPLVGQVAVLHDSVEDSGGKVTFESLAGMGFSADGDEALRLVTKKPGVKYTDEMYLDEIRLIKLNPIARIVKICDLEDNIDLKRIRGRRDGMNDRDTGRMRKYLQALQILDPI